MKKAIIITVIIAVAILAAFIAIGSLSKNVKENVVPEARQKANESVCKALVAQLRVDILKWADKNDEIVYSGFLENNSKEVGSLVSKYEKDFSIKYDYEIHTTDNNYVIKVKLADDSSKFFCGDSSGEGLNMETILEKGNNFSSKTFCSGQVLN